MPTSGKNDVSLKQKEYDTTDHCMHAKPASKVRHTSNGVHRKVLAAKLLVLAGVLTPGSEVQVRGSSDIFSSSFDIANLARTEARERRPCTIVRSQEIISAYYLLDYSLLLCIMCFWMYRFHCCLNHCCYYFVLLR